MTSRSLWERSGLQPIERGTRVTVTSEDTSWPGIFITAFEKMNGKVRFVIGDDHQRCFIQNPKQVTVAEL